MLKILDKNVARQLKEAGFVYTKEKISKNQNLYGFIDTLELRKILAEKYVSCQFVCDSALRF